MMMARGESRGEEEEGGDPNYVAMSGIRAQTLGMQETHVFSAGMVNVATLGYAGGPASLVIVPAVPIPADLVFLEGGNPGGIVIGGGISPASPSAIAGVPGSNPNIGVRRYFTYADDLRFIKGKHSWSMGGWYQRSQQDQSGVALGSAANVAYPSLLAFLQDRPTQAIVVRMRPRWATARRKAPGISRMTSSCGRISTCAWGCDTR